MQNYFSIEHIGIHLIPGSPVNIAAKYFTKLIPGCRACRGSTGSFNTRSSVPGGRACQRRSFNPRRVSEPRIESGQTCGLGRDPDPGPAAVCTGDMPCAAGSVAPALYWPPVTQSAGCGARASARSTPGLTVTTRAGRNPAALAKRWWPRKTAALSETDQRDVIVN